MLLQFSVSNYRSFRKLQTIDLTASSQDKTLPQNCIEAEVPGVNSKHWLKGLAIYGANASGKTTVIEALKALKMMVTTSAKMTDPKDPIPQIEPFALATNDAESPTAFEVIFIESGMRFAYRVAATRERIWHESLRVYPTSRAQTWFSRNWNSEDKKYEWGPDRPAGLPRDERLEKDTLSNMLYLSKHIASNRLEMEPVFRWFKDRLQFLHLDANWHLDQQFSLQHIQDKTPLSVKLVKLLKHADLGVIGARVVEQVVPKSFLNLLAKMPDEFQGSLQERLRQSSFEPELIHRGPNANEVPLSWKLESAGTQRLFALAGMWLNILKDGDVVCVDELDTSMHPLMAMELLRLLFSEKENLNRAQVIFTTHNPLLLDTTLLRRDQVWFTDKNNDGESFLYPLTQYAPRKEESLIRGYLSGRYGAVPFLPKGLLGERPGYETINEEEIANQP